MAVRPTEQARFTSPFSPSGQEGFYGDSDGQIASTCSGPCNSGHYCPEGSTIPDPPDCLPQYFLMYYNDSGVNKPMCRPCNGTLVGPDGAKSWSGSAALDGEAHLYGADSEAGGGSDLTGLTKCWNYTTLPTHITLETLPLQDNFWRQHNWSFKILPCLAENVCIGADPEGLPFHCREGHEGPFCMVCKKEYYKQADFCSECEGSSQLTFVPFYILLGIVIVVVIVAVYKACTGAALDAGDIVDGVGNLGAGVASKGLSAIASATQDAAVDAAVTAVDKKAEEVQEKRCWARLYIYITTRANQIMVKVKILIALYQVLDGIGLVFSVPYPSFYESTLQAIEGVVSIELPQVMPLECIYPQLNLYTMLVIKTIGPIVGIVGLFLLGKLLNVLKCCASKQTAIAALQQTTEDAIFFLLFLIYPSVSSQIFAAFVCEDLPNGDSYLRLDFSISCNHNDPVFNLPRGFWYFYAVAAGIIYPIGVPTLYAYLLGYKFKPQLSIEKQAEIMKRYRDKLAEFSGKDPVELVKLTGPLAAEDLELVKETTGEETTLTAASTSKTRRVGLAELRDKSGTFENVFPEKVRARPWDVDYPKKVPSYVRKLVDGYERRVYWFEIFECIRKILLVGVPVFFAPGSTGQLTLGLLICFFTYGVYNQFSPYVERSDDILQTVCQVQIFFSLLASVILRADPEQTDTAAILSVMLFVTPIIGLFLETPLPDELYKLYVWAKDAPLFARCCKTKARKPATATTTVDVSESNVQDQFA